MKPEQLAKAFNKNVDSLEDSVHQFILSSDPASTQTLRRASRRLGTSYTALPKDLRKDPPIRRYVNATRSLSRVTGKVRDLDIIAAWTAQVGDSRDRKSFSGDLLRLRASVLREALKEAKELSKTRTPSLKPKHLDPGDVEKRFEKVERKLSKRVDKEFDEFMSSQEVDVMHALRKDAKRLRHILELSQNGTPPALMERLQSIQDDLGAIRDHDLVIDYLRSRVKLTSTGALIREEIAKRHARLEDFFAKNRGQGRVVPAAMKKNN